MHISPVVMMFQNSTTVVIVRIRFLLIVSINGWHNVKVSFPQISRISFFFIGILSMNDLIDLGIGGGASILFLFCYFAV